MTGTRGKPIVYEPTNITRLSMTRSFYSSLFSGKTKKTTNLPRIRRRILAYYTNDVKWRLPVYFPRVSSDVVIVSDIVDGGKKLTDQILFIKKKRKKKLYPMNNCSYCNYEFYCCAVLGVIVKFLLFVLFEI